MLRLLLPVTLIVMIGVIWFNEGWKKGLKIVALVIGSLVLLAILMFMLNVKLYSNTMGVISLLFWAVWIIGLIVYNIKEGYIGRF
jgi:hypothetical protein